MLSTDMFSGVKMIKNAFAAGALRTPLRELTALPQAPWLDYGRGKGERAR